MEDLLRCLTAVVRQGGLPAPALARAAALAAGAVPTSTGLRLELAKRADLPPSVLAELAADPEPRVRLAAVGNPACTDDIAMSVVDREADPAILTRLLQRSGPIAMFERLADVLDGQNAFKELADEIACRTALLQAEHLPEHVAITLVEATIERLGIDDLRSDLPPGHADCQTAVRTAVVRHPRCHALWAERLPPSWGFIILGAPHRGELPDRLVRQLVKDAFLDPLCERIVAGKSVSDPIAARLYRMPDEALGPWLTTVTAAVRRAGVEGCNRAGWLRERFLQTDESLAADLHQARTSRDADVLTELATSADLGADVAAALIENPATPSTAACAALRQLPVGRMRFALGHRNHDVAYMAACAVRWPGAVTELTAPVRSEAVRAAVIELLEAHSPAAVSVAEGLRADEVAGLEAWTIPKLCNVPAVASYLAELLTDVDLPVMRLVGELLEGPSRHRTLRELVEVATYAAADRSAADRSAADRSAADRSAA